MRNPVEYGRWPEVGGFVLFYSKSSLLQSVAKCISCIWLFVSSAIKLLYSVSFLTWFLFVHFFFLLVFLSNWGVRLFLCELTFSTVPLGLKIFCNLNSDCDLKRHKTFLNCLYFCSPVPGLIFVFVRGRNLNWIRNLWIQFSGVYLILLPKPYWFHSYLSITLTAREEIVFIIFGHVLEVKMFYRSKYFTILKTQKLEKFT